MLHFLLPWGTLVHLVHLLLYLVHLLHTDRSLATISYKSTAIAMFHLLIHLLSKFCYFAEKAGIYNLSAQITIHIRWAKNIWGGFFSFTLKVNLCAESLADVCLFVWELRIIYFLCRSSQRWWRKSITTGDNLYTSFTNTNTNIIQTQIQISYEHK